MSSTDSYLSFYSTISEHAPISALSLFLLGVMRLAPILALVPFFGSKTPAPVKMGLLLALVTVFFPHIAVTSTTFIGFNVDFIVLCIKEFFVGIILAVFASIPFFMAESSGVIIDFARGASSLQVNDPTTQSQSSPLGILYNIVMIVIFYEIGGIFYFFNAIFDSYTILPADAWVPPQFFQFTNHFWGSIWDLVNRLMTIAIQLAAPCLLAVLMTEMFLGIANRLAPQVQIAFLGMSLKSLIGLGMLALGWFFILKQMGHQMMLWLTDLQNTLQFFVH